MPTLRVFDPPLCCSTAVCGPDADDELVTFSATLRWLKRHGVDVERVSPTSHPEAFMETPVVYDALMTGGQDVLPLVLIDGDIAFRASYPSRDEILAQVDVPEKPSPTPS